jgi:hypothetical protein
MGLAAENAELRIQVITLQFERDALVRRIRDANMLLDHFGFHLPEDPYAPLVYDLSDRWVEAS